MARTAEEGPVSVTLNAFPARVDLSQPVKIHLEIIADSTVTVDKPRYGSTLREGDRAFEYRVRDLQSVEARPLGDGRLQWAYTYELAFVLQGEYELPPAEVTFLPSGTSDSTEMPQEQTVATEAFTIVVTDAEELALSDADLREITRLDPIELPWTWTRLHVGVAAGLVVILILAALFARRVRRRRREQASIPIPADIWARRELAALLAEDLLTRGLVQEFYYRINSIVRGYVERRFGVSAPDMTTEEFLTAVALDKRLGGEIAVALNQFLEACDLVKYAKHDPGPAECDGILGAARDFVESTRERVTPDGSLMGGVAASSPGEECAA